jgi:hypothetical protein
MMKQAAEHIKNISACMQDASAAMSKELLQSNLNPTLTTPKGRQ